ncbi:hypothetical protein GLW08_20390 [Pontibacillus yanchengensis]|uniref:Uncharacterized protein n=2 Tax=Pontibacillus yanchengensis TaxID=462910 RepID=A0ACC7VMG8_9BACI|nr:hypothetical protein [Pontibacillus yanchengensis]MYL35464.1 hypothetical protein [Pontibacillus yanchengensis]MYL55664.1 hypothetical protein [Pontibacillus yanchengensis]
MTAQNKFSQHQTGWERIDRLFAETDELIEEYNNTKKKVELARANFTPERPTLLNRLFGKT